MRYIVYLFVLASVLLGPGAIARTVPTLSVARLKQRVRERRAILSLVRYTPPLLPPHLPLLVSSGIQ